MKLQNIPRATALILTLVLSEIANAAGNVPPPEYDALQDVTVLFSKSWMLTVRRDGSGKLEYGSSPLDSASMPVGSFNFRALYDGIAPALLVTPTSRKCFSVALRTSGQTSVTALYTDNCAVVEQFIATAVAAGRSFDQAHFDKLLHDRPVLSDAP